MDITIRELWNSIKRHKKLIILCTLLPAIIGFILTFFIVPRQYISSGKCSVLIKNKAHVSDNKSLAYQEKCMNAFIEILDSQAFYQKVSEKIDAKISAEQLSKMVIYKPADKAAFFDIETRAASPEEAHSITQTISDLAPEAVTVLNHNAVIQVIDQASMPQSPASPNVLRTTVYLFFTGLVIGIMAAISLQLCQYAKHK